MRGGVLDVAEWLAARVADIVGIVWRASAGHRRMHTTGLTKRLKKRDAQT